MAHFNNFIPCSRLFLNSIYCYHGFPDDFTSNEGPQFISKFWKELFKILEVKKFILCFSSKNWWSNRMSISSIRTIFALYGCTINYHQDGWAKLLPLAKFTYNNTKHASINHTPFFANYKQHPKFDTFNIKNVVSNPFVEDFATQL
jgi:hypothetical protein